MKNITNIHKDAFRCQQQSEETDEKYCVSDVICFSVYW